MKYAVLSDIHANLEALSIVLEKCKEEKVDEYLCLGDIVVYNANPHECLQLIRDLKPFAVVKGNHDEYVSNNDEEMFGFNPHAKKAVLWTKSQLSDEELKYLAKLPLRTTARGSNITLVHATLDSPDSWGYVFDVHHAADNFSYQFTQMCFCGHSHVPRGFCKKPITMRTARTIEEMEQWTENSSKDFTEPAEFSIDIQLGWKYLINVGSVGQPRNKDPRASFAIFDTDEKKLFRHIIPYDIEKAQAKIREAGLPERLASRLQYGK